MLKGTNKKHRNWKKSLAIVTASVTMVALSLAPTCAFASGSIEKEETVYVITDSNGQQNEVIVSDHLKNDSDLDKIDDKSDLSDIENVKGEEQYEKGTGSSLTWMAEGKDIYYQGKTAKEVPVTMDITYTLDGKEVSGKELKDKSGDVTININYSNNTSYNGTKVPFIVMSGFLVQDDCLTDITIDNGKIIDDGEKQMVVGIAAPGLKQDLGLEGEDIGIGDSVTIRGKADKFAVDDIMTVATSTIFDDLDTGKFSDLDYDDEINQLDTGSKKLVEGSKLLYDGIAKMNDSMPDLMNGVNSLTTGAEKLSNGTKQAQKGAEALDEGVQEFSKSLPETIKELDEGTSGLKKISDGVTGGLKQIKQGLDGTDEDEGAVDALGDAEDYSKDVYAYLNLLGGVFDNLSESDKAELKEKLGEETYNKLVGDLEPTTKKAGGVYQTLNSVNPSLEGVSDSLGAYDPEQGTQQKTIIGNMTVLSNGLGNMNEQIKESEQQLSAGLGELVNGSGALKTGVDGLATGAEELAAGMEALQEQSGTLVNGVDQLDAGSLKVSKGMSELYNKGIKKIVDLYNNDLKGLTSGLSDMKNASRDYKTFTQLPAGMDGSTKFIYKTPVTE